MRRDFLSGPTGERAVTVLVPGRAIDHGIDGQLSTMIFSSPLRAFCWLSLSVSQSNWASRSSVCLSSSAPSRRCVLPIRQLYWHCRAGIVQVVGRWPVLVQEIEGRTSTACKVGIE